MQVIVVRGIRGREAVLVSIADRALLATPVTIGDVKDLLEVQTGLPRAAYASLRCDTQLVDGLRDDTVLGECNLVDGLSLTAAAPLAEACVGGADFDHLKAQATEQRGADRKLDEVDESGVDRRCVCCTLVRFLPSRQLLCQSVGWRSLYICSESGYTYSSLPLLLFHVTKWCSVRMLE